MVPNSRTEAPASLKSIGKFPLASTALAFQPFFTSYDNMPHFPRVITLVHVAKFSLVLDRLSPAFGLEWVRSLYLGKEKETFNP